MSLLTATDDGGGDGGAALDAETGHWVLAAMLAGAGAIHLAMAPSHLAESTVMGAGFLVSGAAQLGLALWVAVRPSRTALLATVVASVALIVTWAVSRSIGLPLSGHAGEVEDITVVDGMCVVLELGAVVLAGLLLAHRSTAFLRSTVFASVGVVAVLALAGGVLAAPAARDHAGGGHGHGEEAAAGGHGHDEGGGEAAHDGGVAHDMVADDLGFSELANGQMGSHEHPDEGVAPAEDEIDPETAATLAGQLAMTAPLVQAYPTLADAKAAGYVQQGPFSPGLGVHFGGNFSFNADGDMDPEDIAKPILIFDGIEDDSALAGFMYMAYQETEPEGFAGPLDRWHYHTATCIVYGPDGIETPFGADLTGVTDAMCEAEGGHMIDFTGYMVHVWTVPGYESELGTFSDLNPNITCEDGTYHVIPTAEIGGADTTCRDAAV